MKFKQIANVARDERGIALVTALLLTMISLAMTISLLYMISAGITTTGSIKRYRTAVEAAYGGTELITKDMIPFILQNYSSATLIGSLQSTYSNASAVVSATQQCLQAKITKSTANWPATCSNTLNPMSKTDITITLPGANNQPFNVYAKIVDTVAGNTDLSGVQLLGGGVTASQSFITPQPMPFVYRIEVQGQRQNNPLEKSDVSVLYAY
jgi:hypothetical protein